MENNPKIVVTYSGDSGWQQKLSTAYAYEKVSTAVWKLATGVGGFRARLADAYIELAILLESDLPAELVDDWRKIKLDLTSGKMQFDTQVEGGKRVRVPIGRLYSTLRYMRRNKASDITKRIYALKSNLELYLE